MEQVSRQRLLYISRVEEGKCGACGGSLENSPYKGACVSCNDKHRARQRKRKKMNEWKPGGRGRIPLTAKMGNKIQSECKPGDYLWQAKQVYAQTAKSLKGVYDREGIYIAWQNAYNGLLLTELLASKEEKYQSLVPSIHKLVEEAKERMDLHSGEPLVNENVQPEQ